MPFCGYASACPVPTRRLLLLMQGPKPSSPYVSFGRSIAPILFACRFRNFSWPCPTFWSPTRQSSYMAGQHCKIPTSPNRVSYPGALHLRPSRTYEDLLESLFRFPERSISSCVLHTSFPLYKTPSRSPLGIPSFPPVPRFSLFPRSSLLLRAAGSLGASLGRRRLFGVVFDTAQRPGTPMKTAVSHP